MSRRLNSVVAAFAAVPLVIGLAGCASASGGDEGEGEANETVRIGVVGESDEQWPAFIDAAAEEGITVELVDFGSYEQPEPRTDRG